jgi:hypothetical protein
MNPYLDRVPDNKENSDWEAQVREPAFLQAQKKRESVSAPGAPKDRTSLQPPAAPSDQDYLAPIDTRVQSSNNELPAETALTEKPQNHGLSATLSPVAEDFSRSVKSTEAPRINVTKLVLPDDKPCESPVESVSEASQYQTAANTPLIEQDEPKAAPGTADSADSADTADGPGETVEDGPTAADREQAQKLFDSQDEVVGSEPAAAWLGDPDRGMIREAYMRPYGLFVSVWCLRGRPNKWTGYLMRSRLDGVIATQVMASKLRTLFIQFATLFFYSIPIYTWPTSIQK